jgi:dihydroxy-acid dehydratase
MADIDRISRKVPCLCKVAPMTDKYHIEDVHRAGGIVGILGELARAGLLDTTLPTIHAPTLADAIAQNDIKCTTIRPCRTVPRRAGRRADAGGVLAVRALRCLDTDRSTGCIRDKAHAYSQDGGLAVLYGNLAERAASSRRRAWMKAS